MRCVTSRTGHERVPISGHHFGAFAWNGFYRENLEGEGVAGKEVGLVDVVRLHDPAERSSCELLCHGFSERERESGTWWLVFQSRALICSVSRIRCRLGATKM